MILKQFSKYYDYTCILNLMEQLLINKTYSNVGILQTISIYKL